MLKTDLLESIYSNKPPNQSAIDLCHNMTVFGITLSLKPKEILEIGIGSGYITKTLISAMNYNKFGNLTCVDSCKDWDHKEPSFFNEFKNAGVNILIKSEYDFIQSNIKMYDLIISDADHKMSHQWIEKTASFLNVGGFLFFHDVRNTLFPNLNQHEEIMRKNGFCCYCFDKKTRDEERCERGWLMCFKESSNN